MSNIRITLLKVKKYKEKYEVLNKKEVIGIERSLTTNEFETSIQTKLKIERKVLVVSFLYSGEKYVKVGETYYRVERTYDLGQYIEIYLANTSLTSEEFLYE
jgi:hypothetical protein